MIGRPVEDGAERGLREGAGEHGQVGDLDLHGVVSEQRVKVRRVVVVEVDADPDAAEPVKSRHSGDGPRRSHRSSPRPMMTRMLMVSVSFT